MNQIDLLLKMKLEQNPQYFNVLIMTYDYRVKGIIP